MYQSKISCRFIHRGKRIGQAPNRFGLKLATLLVGIAAANAAAQTPASFRTVEFERNWGLGVIGAEYAFARGYSGAGIRLGIADSPIQLTHPEFAGRIYYPNPFPAFPVPDFPVPSHGTHVMGLAAAARNGVGMMGVAYEASLASVISYPSPGYPWPVDWAEQLLDAGVSVMNGSFGPQATPADNFDGVPNPNYRPADFQIYTTDMLLTQIDQLTALSAADIVMVYAAGNNSLEHPGASKVPAGLSLTPLVTPGLLARDQPRCDTNLVNSDVVLCLIDASVAEFTPDDPDTWDDAFLPVDQIEPIDGSALIGSLLVVVATDEDNQIVDFSNRCGATADWCLAAPGTNLPSSFPMDVYAFESGTSMAAPLVAGSAALLRQAFPYLTARQIIEIMLTNANSTIGDPEIVGHGLFDLASAINGPIEFGKPSLIAGNDPIFPMIFAVDTAGYDSVWRNDIRGVGGFSKAGEGLLTLTGMSTYIGPTTVTGGELRVNGSIAQSSLTVAAGGTLSGTGVVGDTLVMGILSPGTSVGTLTVDGDLRLADGSRLLFEIDRQQNSDLVVVRQSALIEPGAQFELVVEDVVFLDKPYQVLTAQSITGTFEPQSGRFTFIDLNFVALQTSLSMVIERNAVAMASFAQTDNQRAVAQAIDTQRTGDSPYDAVLLNEDPTPLSRWFQDWSGEIYATNQAVILGTTRLVSERLGWRLYDRGQAIGTTAHGVGTDEPTRPWADIYGNWQRLGASAAAASASAESANLLFGVEHTVTEHFRLGAAFGISQIQAKVVNSRASTTAQHLALYGQARLPALEISGGAVQSWYQTQVSRSLPNVPREDGIASLANLSGYSTMLFADLGLPLALGQATRLTPFVQVNQTWLSFGGFGETRGSAPLTGQASRAAAGFGTIGLRANLDWQAASTKGQLRAMAGWQRGWGDLSPTTTLAFDSGQAFSVSSAPLAKDALAVSLGVSVQIGQASEFSLVYAGAFGSGNQSQSVQAQLQWRF